MDVYLLDWPGWSDIGHCNAIFKKITIVVEARIKTLAAKDDLINIRNEMSNIRKEIGDSKTDTIKWMFIFWIGQVGATMAIVTLFLKK